MDNQERNREALIEHIAEQDRIIRRRNQQIENQAANARESQRAIDELCVRAVKAERELDRLADMHAQQVKTIAELQRELGLTRPDWVDAPAVLARRESEMDAPPQVWANVGRDVWESGTLRAHTQFLRGVTPLYPEGN